MTDRGFSFHKGAVKSASFSLYEKTDGALLRYAVGQPMGALSSWAGLAITHHFLVQLCAYRLG